MEANDAREVELQGESDDVQGRSLAIFGDSIANGLGVGDKRFPVLLAESLAFELHDFTGSALPVSESLGAFRTSSSVPYIALIAHGATEAIIRPDDRCLRFLPPRWRRMGWMDPRPYYSRRLRRRLIERAESALRWRVKNALIRSFGGNQLMSCGEFTSNLEELVSLLKKRGTHRIIVIEPPDLDEKYFPGSPAAHLEYFTRLSCLDVEVVSLRGQLEKWDDFFSDHFHPNVSGHGRIAGLLYEHVLAKA